VKTSSTLFAFIVWISTAVTFFADGLDDFAPTWSSTVTYADGDLVTSGTLTYVAQQDVPINITPGTNAAYWVELGSASPDDPEEEAPGVEETPDPTDVTGLADPGSPNLASGLTDATSRQFVYQQYLDFVGRAPAEAGLAYWAGTLDSGTKSRAKVVDTFVAMPEFDLNVAPVARLYQAYFLRIPNTEGLDYWVDQKLSGAKDTDAISNNFANTAEFKSRYGSLSNSQFVELIYQNVMGRPPAASGLAFWTQELDAGRKTRGSVMTNFSESGEYKAKTLNEVRVMFFFYGLLRRAPAQGGFDYWVGRFDAGDSAEALIDGFLVSPEYQGRFEE